MCEMLESSLGMRFCAISGCVHALSVIAFQKNMLEGRRVSRLVDISSAVCSGSGYFISGDGKPARVHNTFTVTLRDVNGMTISDLPPSSHFRASVTAVADPDSVTGKVNRISSGDDGHVTVAVTLYGTCPLVNVDISLCGQPLAVYTAKVTAVVAAFMLLCNAANP